MREKAVFGGLGVVGLVSLALAACGESSVNRSRAGSGESGSSGSAGESSTGGGAGEGAGGASGTATGGAATGGAATGGAATGGAATGGAEQGGGAGAGTGDDAGAGGSAGDDDGVEPLVVVIDADDERFAAYDRHGELVKNYVDELDLGAEYGTRTVAVNYLNEPWDGQIPSSPNPYLYGSTKGLVEDLPSSLVIVRGDALSGDAVKLRVLSALGEPVAEHVIEGGWQAFRESPKRGFLYAISYTNTSSYPNAAVFRMSDAHLVWQGQISMAAFARDDSHFMFTSFDGASPAGIVDLATGEVTALTSSELPSGLALEVRAALSEHMIVAGRVSNQGRLWSIDWQGNVQAFGTALENTDDTLQGFNGEGTKAVWSRATNILHPMPYSHVGTYAIDLSSTTASEWDGPDYSCFERPNDHFFKVESNALLKCACDDGACSSVAELPAVPTNWVPAVTWSRDRGVVLVEYQFNSAVAPDAFPDSFCFDAKGTRLATLPNGSADLDETGRLVLVRSYSTGTGEMFVTDLETGELHSLGSPLRAALAYP